jgi:hypothetical protein
MYTKPTSMSPEETKTIEANTGWSQRSERPAPGLRAVT